jgi:Tol biopolymer transport system component
MNKRLTPKLASFLVFLSVSALAQSLQLVSVADSSQTVSAGGGGDSWGPTLSRDGRYVLFSSTANNLVLATNNNPIPLNLPAVLNVFLRDRTNRTTTLVSADLSGVAGGNDDSIGMDVSTNGRYALFESAASNLIQGDTNVATDVFVRDVVSGSIVLVSVNTNGVAGNGPSAGSAMTPDGRFVAFVSSASDLVPGDTNGIPDVFVRDLQTGKTVLASVGAGSASTNFPIGSSEAPVITPDGRYVAFYSTATNLVAGAPASGDIYVRDLMAGTTTWVSAGARASTLAALGKTNIVCFNHVLSDDGQALAYEASPNFSSLGLILRYNTGTSQTQLVHTNAAVDGISYPDVSSLQMTPDGRYVAFLANTNDTSGETTCVVVWDAQSGATTLASGDLTGAVPDFSICEWPAISSDGRFVLFLSSASDLVTNDTPGEFTLYRRDLQAGTTTLVDVDTNGAGSILSPNSQPSMSDDGRFVGFDFNDDDLLPNDRNHFSDAFVRDLNGGTTELISVRDPRLPCTTPNGGSSILGTSISGDGRFVAFLGDADNLIPNDTNLFTDVFVHDMLAGSNLLVSLNTNGFSGNGGCGDPALSPDGRYVAFTSSSSDLVPGDTNFSQDVFVRDLATGSTTLVSMNRTGTGPGNTVSSSPVVGAGGRFVLFRSRANNLASGLFLGENLFLRDRDVGTNYALTHNGVSVATMTPDGRFVFFAGTTSTGSFSGLYGWDSQNAAFIYTNTFSAAGVGGLAISSEGKTLAYSVPNSLHTVDFVLQTNRVLDSAGLSYKDLRLNADGTLLTCTRVSSLGGVSQVFLYDTRSGNTTPVSRNAASGELGNGPSDSPDISFDGRFIAYRSAASNIVAGVINGFPNILLYDIQNSNSSLLSVSRNAPVAADNRSLLPVFSGDGRTLFFTSWASDLVPLDFNQNSDIFAFSFFYLNVAPNSTGGALLSWPYSSGKTYRVQFKDTAGGFEWQDLTGAVTNGGNKSWFLDPTVADKRFYRVIAQ